VSSGGWDPAAWLISFALRLLPAARADWARAMRADFARLDDPAERRRFALGCLRVSISQGAGWWIATYLVLAGAALRLLAASGIAGAFLVELGALLLIAPPALRQIEGGNGALRLGPERSARTSRRVGYVLVTACVLAAAGFLAAELPESAAGWFAVVLVVLTADAIAMLAVTSAGARSTTAALTAGGVFGAAAGLAMFALVPFNESFAVHSAWLTTLYPPALALVVLGAPCAAAARVIKRGGDSGQGVMAAAAAGVVASLVLFGVGVGSLWVCPGLIHAGVFDKGADWLPPDATSAALGYLAWLIALPLLGLLAGALALAIAGPSATGTRLLAALTIALGIVPFYPLLHGALDGRDTAGFGSTGATQVAFSANGQALLTGQELKGNPAQASILWSLSGPQGAIRRATFAGAAVFSPDGRTLAAQNQLWDVADPTHPTRIAGFSAGEPSAFSPDGRLLATDDNGKLLLWNVSELSRPRRIGALAGGIDYAFSPDSRILATSASCSWETTASATRCGTALWSIAGDARPRRLITISGTGAVFSPDGRALATRAVADTVVLWSLADRAHPRRIAALSAGTGGNTPSSVLFSPDSRFVVAASDSGNVRIWEVADPRRSATLRTGRLRVSSNDTVIAFSTDGRTLDTVVGNARVTRWNVSDPLRPTRIAVRTRPRGSAGVVALSPSLATVVGAALDGGVELSFWRIR
jgi:hypothetical protein